MRILYVVGIVLCLLLPDVQAQDLDDVVTWTGEITLEEKDEVWTNRIMVRVEPDGFLVGDVRENQVREYSRSGELIHYFGERDPEAPGGLMFPGTPLRMSDGTILVPNTGSGALSIVDASGNQLERHERIATAATFSIEPLPIHDYVLFVGPTEPPHGTPDFLHHLDPLSGEVKKSFYPLPDAFGSHAGLLHTISGIVSADVYSELVAVGFLLSDTITLLDYNGNIVNEIEPDLTLFRKVAQTDELHERGEFDQELVRRSLFNTLFWLNEDILLVQFTNSHFDDQGERQLDRVLAAVSTAGEVLFEVNNTPRLFAVDRESGELYFADPDYDFESHWRVGQINEQFLR